MCCVMLDALLWDDVASRRGHSAGSGLRGRQTACDTDVGPSLCHLTAQSPGEPHQVEIMKSLCHEFDCLGV